MKRIGYYNGKIGPVEEMTVPMLDRAVYFGDGCYEAVPLRNGVGFGMTEHIDRFYVSCGLLQIPFKLSKDELRRELQRCIDAAGSDETAMLYWQCSRGTGYRAHAFPDSAPNLLAMVSPCKYPDMVTRIRLITAEDIRFHNCNIKTLNLINNCVAANRAESLGCQEAVLHRGDVVTECAHSNISILKDGALITHPADQYILRGVSRGFLIDVCAHQGVPVYERPFTVAELMDADEVLVTSSSALFRAACEIDGQAVGGRAPEILQRLMDEYLGNYLRATERA